MSKHSSKIVLNTPSTGMIQRSNPKSFFIRFQKSSTAEDWMFPIDGSQPKLLTREVPREYVEIVILQILVFGDNQYLCEVIKKEDLREAV